MSGIMAENQASVDEAAQYGRPDIARGAWFSQGSTRMDDQQHVLSGLISTLDAMEGYADRQRRPVVVATDE